MTEPDMPRLIGALAAAREVAKTLPDVSDVSVTASYDIVIAGSHVRASITVSDPYTGEDDE